MQPGALIASGRDGDIFEFGDSLVLGKTRDGRSLEHEARIMRHAADHGYPVPEIHDVRANGSEIIMQRIEGPLMMEPMAKRPWTMPRYASLLADLHDQLHKIPAPDWLHQSSDGGDRLLHLDLHPLNVLLSAHGPVVIDWSNAAPGDGLSDVALTYVLLTCPRMPGPRALQIAAQPARVGLARLFTHRYRGRDLRERIAVAADLKTLDRNMAPDEIANLRLLADRMRDKTRLGPGNADQGPAAAITNTSPDPLAHTQPPHQRCDRRTTNGRNAINPPPAAARKRPSLRHPSDSWGMRAFRSELKTIGCARASRCRRRRQPCP